MDKEGDPWRSAGMKVTTLMLGLLMAVLCGTAAAEQTLPGLMAEYEEKMQKLSVAYRAAKTKEEKDKVLADRPDPVKTVASMVPLLSKEEDETVIMKAAGWIIMQSRQGAPDEVYELVEKHKGSKELTQILHLAPYDRSGRLVEIKDWAREHSEHAEVRGVAAFINSKDRNLPEEKKLEEAKFAIANVGDAEFRGRSLKEQAQGTLFELENLAIGKEAPNIEGEDQDGATFSLAEYRGKVVVLDFWGDW